MLRFIIGTISLSCMGLGGCANVGYLFRSEKHPAVVAAQLWSIEAETDALDETTYFREYTPWRRSVRRVGPDASTPAPPLRLSTYSPEGVAPEAPGTNPVLESVPDDPAALEQWLARRREKMMEVQRTQQAWFSKIDAEAVLALQSICTGC